MNYLYDDSHLREEEKAAAEAAKEEAPARLSSGPYVGLLFAAIFEAILGISAFIVYAVYHFLKAWIGGR